MLLLFVLCLLVSPLVYGLGRAIGDRLAPMPSGVDRFWISTLCGLMLLATLLLGVALIQPLDSWVPKGLLIAGALGCGYRYRRDLLIDGASAWPLWLGGLLASAAYCSQPVFWPDSALYHYQAIRWLQEYGVVKGLGLLHFRLAFYSSAWFTLPAAVDPIFAQQSGVIANCLLLWLCLSRAVIALWQGQDLVLGVALGFLVSLAVGYGMPNSPTPDLIAMLLPVIVLWLLDESRPPGATQYAVWFALLGVAIKLSVVALAIFMFVYVVVRRQLRWPTLLAGCVLLPAMAASWLSSGCLLHPAAMSCHGDLPWAIAVAEVKSEAAQIYEFARWGGLPHAPDYAAFEWLPHWLARGIENQLLAAMVILSVIAACFYGRRQRAALGLMVVGLAVGLSAPALRFLVGYVAWLPAVALVASHLFDVVAIRRISATMVLVFPAVMIVLIPNPFQRSMSAATRSFDWIAPVASMPGDFVRGGGVYQIQGMKPLTYRESPMAGLGQYFPAGDSGFCWKHALPCAPFAMPDVQLSEPGKLSGGFVRRQVPK